MILKKTFYFIIALYLLLTACHILDRPEEDAVIDVGTRHITEGELRQEIQRIIIEMGITDQEAELGIHALVNKVVENCLIVEYGKENGIILPDDELESAIRHIKRDYPEDAFQEMLLNRYIDFDKWKEELRKELLIKKIITRAAADIPPITFKDTAAYFETHREEFGRREMVEVRQIVTRTMDEAEKLHQQLNKGGEMGELAKSHSITPEAENGGMLGWISKGELEEPMEKTIFSLPVGKASAILKTSYGYHIFEVLSRRSEGLKGLPEVMAEIESMLLLRRKESFYEGWLEQLKSRYPVKIDKEIFKEWSMDG